MLLIEVNLPSKYALAMALSYIPAPNKTEKIKQTDKNIINTYFYTFPNKRWSSNNLTGRGHCGESSGENGMEYKRQKTRGNMEKLDLQERMNQGLNFNILQG